MQKRKIKIKLNEKEDAIIYYEKTLGKNITVRKRASVLYCASKGVESITELQKKCVYTRGFITNTLNGYAQKGIAYIYDCSRGIKHSVLDSIESELLDEFEKNPPASIPEAISRIKEKFGIELTETPVRNWLKRRDFITLSQSQYPQKPT